MEGRYCGEVEGTSEANRIADLYLISFSPGRQPVLRNHG